MNPLETIIAELDTANAVLIGGEWRAGSGDFAVSNPADGSLICQVADGTAQQATEAAAAAHDAFRTWADTAPRERAAVLHAAYAAMLDRLDVLAELIVLENGKSLLDAQAEIRYAASFFQWYAEEAVRNNGNFGPAPAGGARTVVTHRPVGVAALITPWNFPAAMITRKLGPALAAGCTTVLKPASETPLTALAIVRLLMDQGLPAGVVNVVPTSQASNIVGSWMDDDRVRKISFTGSTAVGQTLLRQAANRVLNVSMELGGNAPFVVMPDADLNLAVEGAMVAKFRGGGQACTAANRFYVHADVADEFSSRFADRISALRVGPGTDQRNQIGPLIHDRAVRRLQMLVEDAVRDGSVVAARAELPEHLPGSYFAPTLLDHVRPQAQVVQEEIFGPIAPIVRWKSEELLLSQVNGSELGLAAYVYSRDAVRAMRLAEKIDAGMIGINRAIVSDASAPFGGMKQSGLGREGARAGIVEFQETQYLSVDWP